MLIECPSCHTRATLPDSKEGAKVRCGECGRVYLALPAGAGRRPRRSSSSTGPAVGIALGVLALVGIGFLAFGGGESEPPAEVAAPEEAPPRPVAGWRSAPVQAAVAVHEAAHTRDAARLRELLDAERIWEHRRTAAEDNGPAATEASFSSLTSDERSLWLLEVIDELHGDDEEDLVAGWRPYDGDVLRETDDGAVVRLAVTSRQEGSAAKRWVEWSLSRRGDDWRAWHWERWISPEEQKAERIRRGRGYEKVTLTDGSVVLEREPEPLAHLEDTPPELAARIDQLYATMLDLDLTKEGVRARQELVEIGRPAIPKLLTGLYETPLDTLEQSIQVNMIVVALRDITGQNFGYEPMELVGSSVGTTRERRESAIRQWFAWWYRKQDVFTEKETADGLEGLIELTDKEKRALERSRY